MERFNSEGVLDPRMDLTQGTDGDDPGYGWAVAAAAVAAVSCTLALAPVAVALGLFGPAPQLLAQAAAALGGALIAAKTGAFAWGLVQGAGGMHKASVASARVD